MTLKALAAIVVVIVGLVALLWNDGTNMPQQEPAANRPMSVTGAPSSLEYRGLAIQIATSYKALETYERLIGEVAAMGANAVLLTVPGHMEHARSQSIYIDARKVPAKAELIALITRGRELGLKVVLMPIVLLRNPRGSEWRGVIEPPDWDTWWSEYQEFVLYFADIAREGGAAAFMVGSELVSTEKETARWVKLTEAVRPRYSEGLLGYSANWDHYRPVQFWDHLDFIGMTSYYTLAEDKNPSVEEIVARWEPIRNDILAWQRRVGKPILLTEVGWCSQEGAASAPWNYYQNQHATPAALEEQRRLYEAFAIAWRATPELMGAIWWEWTDSPGGPGDYDYTPRNKPAEQVLREWLASRAPAASQPTASGPAPPASRPVGDSH